MSTATTNNHTSTEKTSEELRLLGNEKFRSLNYGAALMCYTQAIDKNPENFAIYYNRAVTLVKMDAMKEAKDDLLKSLELNPDYIPSLCQIGFIYLYEGNTPDSLESYIKVVKLNMNLPNQLNRFKAQLKEAIRLAESRCKQQEYPQSFIDSIITPEIRSELESYPNLPTHMIESGIPPVAFGNVPISHQFENASAVIARASIPISVNGLRSNNNNNNNNNNDNNNNNNNDTNNTNNTNDISRMLNLPEIMNSLNGQGISASVSIGGPQSPDELMNVLGNITNTPINNSNNNGSTPVPATTTATSITTSSSNSTSNSTPATTTSTTPTIIHAPITHTATGLSTDILQRHREAHQAALNRAAELRRQREQHNLNNNINSNNITSATATTGSTTAPPITATSTSTSNNNNGITETTDNNTNNTNNNNNNNSSAINTTVGNGTGADFARQIASTIATQLTNAAVQNANQGNSNATPNQTAIQSLAHNLSSIASGVIGSLSGNNNNFASVVTNDNGNNNNNNNSNSNTPLDADLEMDLD